MDGVWLVLDSLSFGVTPFAPEGPDTMPNYADLVGRRGINFTSAYAPGPFSPSSHSSFFTGELPSTTGMYEAYPRFDNDLPTIGDVMSETHTTHLVTSNHFLFQGLDEGFDHTDDLGRQYMVFEEASDPKDFSAKYDDDPRWRRYLNLVVSEGKPIRSLVNGLNYKVGGDQEIKPKSWGDEENFQYASTMCDMIRRRLSESGDSFVVANFMDLHSPFEVSDEALERYFPDTPHEDLPLEVAARRDKLRDEKSYDAEQMFGLYKAAIWDFDRKFTPLVEDLVETETFVAVLADHGWYDTNAAYSDERLHVPLTLFAPGESARTVDRSVSLRSLPRTTTEVMRGDDGGFNGPSLLEANTDQTAIAEVIHKPNDIYEKTLRVYVNRPSDDPDPADLQHDIVVFRGDAKVQFVADEFEAIRGSGAAVDELEREARALLSGDIRGPGEDVEAYDEQTERRLKRLGYLE